MIKVWWMIIRSYRKRMLGMWLIFAVVILMITMVDQIVINIDREIDVQTKPLVGADLVVESSQVLSWADALAIEQILSGRYEKLLSYVQFYSTVGNTDNPKLVQVQWVQSWYPLYGEIIVSMIADGSVVNNPVQFSGALVDEQTYELIGRSGGIHLWEQIIPVVWIITSAPSAGINIFDEGRKVIIPYEIVESTALTDMGSRVEYQLQVKLINEIHAENLEETIETQFDKKYSVRLARDRVEQLGWLIEQLDQYVSLILIVTVMLSLVMMSTATMTMTITIRSTVAMMRVLGLTRSRIAIMMTVMYGSMFVVGAVVWVIISRVLFVLLTTVEITQGFVWSWSVVVSVSLIACIGFVIGCWQPLWQLVMTHPLALLNSDDAVHDHDRIVSLGILWAWSWLILLILTGSWVFSLLVVAATGVVLSWWYWCMMWWFRILTDKMQAVRQSSFGWFDAVRQMIVPGNQTWLLVWWLTIALVSFCVIVSVSVSFLDRLRISSVDQPNLFVLNIRTQDVDIITALDPQARLYDTILGRIQFINGVSLSDYLDAREPSQRWGFTREFNMTSVRLDNSPIVDGWALWSGWVSLDQQFAKDLGVWLGDRLTITVQGRVFDLIVTNLRKSIRTGTEPFFYMQLDNAQFEQAPRSWFWITRQQSDQLIPFKKQMIEKIWPHLSFVDIAVIVKLVTDISTKIITIIVAFMGIIIVLLLCVSIASNEASALVSKQWYRLYHILGMTKSDLIRKSWRMVWLYGLVVMILVVILTSAILWYIYSQASILTWLLWSLVPMIGGSMLVIVVMIGSYWLFHRAIIAKI